MRKIRRSMPSALWGNCSAAGMICLVGSTVLGIGISGCGGNRATEAPSAVTVASTGRATLAVRWPEPSSTRLIPFAANSIKVRLTVGDRLLGEALLVRPAAGGVATASFDRLPTGTLTVDAKAYPNADGTGVAQATAQTTATITAGQVAEVRLALASTITQLAATPNPVSLNPGQTATISVSAQNAAGETVLFSNGTLSRTSQSAAVATIDPTGLVTAVSSGSTTITITEIESGITTTVPVQVSNPNAVPTTYDGFDYPVGITLTGQNGGFGWMGTWGSLGSGSPTQMISGSLTFGKLAVSGNAIKTTDFNPHSEDRNWIPVSPDPGTVRFWSALLRPESVTGGFPGPYFGINVGDRFVGKGSSNALLGIERGGSGEFTSTGILPTANTTYFLVVRVSFSTTGDTYDLFVNPTPGQPLPATPNTSQVRPHATTLFNSTGFAASVPCVFDELRSGPTWESVSPTAP